MNLKKRLLVPMIGMTAGVVIPYMLRKRKNKDEDRAAHDPLVRAGIPDQIDRLDHDLLENSKMVSEGSQFGVQYFNEVVDDQTFMNKR